MAVCADPLPPFGQGRSAEFSRHEVGDNTQILNGCVAIGSSPGNGPSPEGYARNWISEHPNGQRGLGPKGDAKAVRWIVSRISVVEAVSVAAPGQGKTAHQL